MFWAFGSSSEDERQRNNAICAKFAFGSKLVKDGMVMQLEIVLPKATLTTGAVGRNPTCHVMQL